MAVFLSVRLLFTQTLQVFWQLLQYSGKFHQLQVTCITSKTERISVVYYAPFN